MIPPAQPKRRPASCARDALSRPRPPVLWLPTGLWSIALVAGLVWLAGERREEPRTPEARTPPVALAAAPSLWQPVPQSAPVYVLDPPEGRALGSIAHAIERAERGPAPLPETGLPQIYEARQRTGGGREDVITVGGPAHPVHLRIEIRRGVPEAAQPRFYVDLVRRAAEAGLAVTRSALPVPLATKFGPGEAAAATFEGGATCLAFRFAHPDVSFRLAGWLCGSPAQPAREEGLVCALDRLVLAPGVEDAVLRVLFARAESRRTAACGAIRLAGDP